MERKNMWEHYTKEQERELEELAVRYRKCLDQSKTERECVTLSIAMAEENGYQNIEDCIREGVTARQMVLSVRLSSATTRFVSRGSKPRSRHSTEA